MAATLAKGTTVLKNAAREPEIVDLVQVPAGRWARRSPARAPRTSPSQGVDRLHGATHPVVADRIELGTYMLAPRSAGGEVELPGRPARPWSQLLPKSWKRRGFESPKPTGPEGPPQERPGRGGERARPSPFPGFPTDLQAQMMALLCTADGTSVLEETIFENRFMHAPELIRMGARIEVHGGTATVTGVDKLKGAPVMATDLRASVSPDPRRARGGRRNRVARVYHLDRGYERVEEKLRACGRAYRADAGRMSDATFEDGGERPLRLVAQDADDLPVISALVQDAVLTVTDMKCDPKRRRFALLVNRFRWEDRAEAAERVGRAYERVRSVLVVEDVLEGAKPRL